MALMTASKQPASPGKRSSVRGSHDPTRLWQLLTFILAIAGWAAVAAAGWVGSQALPSPLSVYQALAGLVRTADFWAAVGETLRGAVVGLFFAVLIGIPLGLMTGTYASAERASRLLVDILRSFPVIALLPVFLLVMGSTPSMKATVVFIACVFPIFLQAQYGARVIDHTIEETVRSYRIPRLLRYRKVTLPNATPSIMTGLRLAATTSVLVAIAVEILTTVPGMGHMITEAQQNGNAAGAFAYIFTAGLIGYTINKCSELLEGWLLRWRPPAAAA